MRSLLVFVPVLGAPILHAPVLALDVLPGLKRPLDFGASWRGRRIFGGNKTWRGALFMVAGVLIAALALWQWPAYRHALPDDIENASPALIGVVIGLGVVLGELPNSFAKRRLDIGPGRRASGLWGVALSVWDQADFVPLVALLLLPIWQIPFEDLLLAIVVVGGVHFGINLIGYAIGARKTLV
ncbi:MAG TPA: CDP-archaeol synthase [Thermoleophilaceae bacterium]